MMFFFCNFCALLLLELKEGRKEGRCSRMIRFFDSVWILLKLPTWEDKTKKTRLAFTTSFPQFAKSELIVRNGNKEESIQIEFFLLWELILRGGLGGNFLTKSESSLLNCQIDRLTCLRFLCSNFCELIIFANKMNSWSTAAMKCGEEDRLQFTE